MSTPSTALTDDPETTGGGLSSAVGAPEPETASVSAPAPTSEPTSNSALGSSLTPPSPEQPPTDDLSGLRPSVQAAQQASAQDLPRLSRLKAALAGFLLSGIPGAVTGAADPQFIQSEVAGR